MDAVLQALSDESRRTVLEALRGGPATVGELAALLPIARPGVSRHLRVLREAGLVEVRQEAQWRYYSLNPEPLAEVDDWLGHYRALWRQRLDALHTEVARGTTHEEEEAMSNDSHRLAPRILGSLRADGETGAVRVEDRYATDITTSGRPSTEPERMARWVADVEGELRLGGRFRVRFTSGWAGDGRVEECRAAAAAAGDAVRPATADETVIEAALTAVRGARRGWSSRSAACRSASSPPTGPGGRPTSRTSQRTSPDASRTTGAARWTELTPMYRDLA